MTEQIWYYDITGFITKDTFHKILPLQYMNLDEKLNAITRFFLYLSILLALIRVDYRYLVIGITIGLLTIPIYEFENKERKLAEKFLRKNNVDIQNNQLCTISSVENPFMNPSVTDIKYSPDRPEACPVENPMVKNQIERNYDKRVFRDVTDIFGRDNSERQFYTVPSSTIPNKQGEYAEWLYGNGATCKEGNGVECEYRAYRYINR